MREEAKKRSNKREHVAVACIGQQFAIGRSSHGGRCMGRVFCAHRHQRNQLTTRHAEIDAVDRLLRRLGEAKFARRRNQLRVWSFAFAPGTPGTPTDLAEEEQEEREGNNATADLVGARPCASCTRCMHHMGVPHITFSVATDDGGTLVTMTVPALLQCTTPSFGDRRVEARADRRLLADAEGRCKAKARSKDKASATATAK